MIKVVIKIMSSELKLKKRKIGRSGDHHFITIPKILVDSNQIDLSKKYTVILLEEKETEKKEEDE